MPTGWEEIQKKIRDCDVCRDHPRVAVKIRQQTLPANQLLALVLVGLAPPYEKGVSVPKVANSATNNPSDKLRLFIEETLAQPWSHLTGRGLFLIHAVKCAIVPNAHGSQDPPRGVVGCCNPVGFAPEFRSLRPPRVLTLGDMARGAVLRTPGVKLPAGITLTTRLGPLQQSWPRGVPCTLDGTPFTLYPARFPRTPEAKAAAASVIRDAARAAGLVGEHQ